MIHDGVCVCVCVCVCVKRRVGERKREREGEKEKYSESVYIFQPSLFYHCCFGSPSHTPQAEVALLSTLTSLLAKPGQAKHYLVPQICSIVATKLITFCLFGLYGFKLQDVTLS